MHALPVLTAPVPSGVDAAAIADEAIEAAFKLIHDRFREAGFSPSGDVTPGEASVLDMVGKAFVGMVAFNLPRTPLKVGDRVRLAHTLDRYPHFRAREGMTGEVTHADDELVSVKLDEHLEGAEEWDNEIHWYPSNNDDDPTLDVVKIGEHVTRFPQ